MTHTLAALAELVSGTLTGDGNQPIAGAAAIESAGTADITFLLDDGQLRRLEHCQAAALVIGAKVADHPAAARFARIVVDDPLSAFLKIVPKFRPLRSRPARGIAPTAVISPTANIDPDCWIGPHVTIGADVVIGRGCDIHPGVVIGDGCRIGCDVTLYPNVVLYADVFIDDRSILHAGAVIGADGFGYRFRNNRFEKIPQLGWVHIHADVEIGACTMVDRGAIGATIIGEGTKLDNMVQIAHNCEIGKHNVFASQVGLAGSCSTGDYVRIAGQVGVKDHVRMNSGCSIGAKGGVHKDIPAGETWIGYPATPEAEQKRLVFSLKRVPEMRDQMKAMEVKLATLTAELAALKGEPNLKVA
ncbi:MAG: UDP-3-O-(3-hydroxymyristoyl)glucosamine N-acyltransferase [Planctomycetaceae bacterium]|nr:UDP-3-O-(3-hydroxymyristoyl)glucosamine N-acyltransferase [Planctomycetaceae bacterium]